MLLILQQQAPCLSLLSSLQDVTREGKASVTAGIASNLLQFQVCSSCTCALGPMKAESLGLIGLLNVLFYNDM